MVRGPCGDRSSGALWWCLGGLWIEMGGGCWLLSRLVHIWVMYNMVMDCNRARALAPWVLLVLVFGDHFR